MEYATNPWPTFWHPVPQHLSVIAYQHKKYTDINGKSIAAVLHTSPSLVEQSWLGGVSGGSTAEEPAKPCWPHFLSARFLTSPLLLLNINLPPFALLEIFIICLNFDKRVFQFRKYFNCDSWCNGSINVWKMVTEYSGENIFLGTWERGGGGGESPQLCFIVHLKSCFRSWGV